MQENKLGLKIYFLTKLIQKQIDSKTSDDEFTSTEGRILHYLLGQKESCEIFQKDIEAEFKIRRSTATELLQALEKKEYIKRIPTQYDARKKRIILLDKAKKLAPKVDNDLNDIDVLIKKGLSDKEVHEFERIVDIMITNAKEADK